MIDLKEIVNVTSSLKLLYVEDEEKVRISTLPILQEFFKNITVAVDGEDGVEKFNNSIFDVIITDISMPKLNGLKMSKKIRETNKTIPIIVHTAYDENDYFMESIEIGVDGYLLKPIDIDKFIQILNKIVINIKHKNEAIELKKKLERRSSKRIDKILSNSDR